MYDAQLSLDAWKPTQAELRILAGCFYKFARAGHAIQRLDVDSSLALKIFEDNPFKVQQIPDIAAGSASGQTVTIYRVG